MAQELVPLGKLITGPDPGRDSYHVAAVPCVATGAFLPGERVGVVRDGSGAVAPADGFALAITSGAPVGVVDPYLEGPVAPGDKFYVLLFPNTITGLRHAWFNDTFPPETGGAQRAAERRKRSEFLSSVPGFNG